MEKKDLIKYEGNRVKITLKNNFYYDCIIKKVAPTFIRVTDKKNKTVFIDYDNIRLLEVLG